MLPEHQSAEEPSVLHVNWLVEAELDLDRDNRRTGRVLAHVLGGELVGVLPRQPGDQEEDRVRDHADHDQQEDRGDQAPNDKSDHCGLFTR